jgi:hypothetical protein
MNEFAIAVFVAAFAFAFFSFAVAAAAAAAAVVEKVRVVAAAFVGSPFLLVVVVVVVGGKAVHRSFFVEFDLLAVHPVHRWYRQVRSMDLIFVVWLRTMLHYYSL